MNQGDKEGDDDEEGYVRENKEDKREDNEENGRKMW